MAINIKEILMNEMLRLCETSSLETITIKQLLDHTGISRQTFYNHFLDKNDLIQHIYLKKVIPNFHHEQMTSNFYEALLRAFNQMKRYQNFMMQACRLEGQNCLRDYIFQHCKEFDLKWHQSLYGSKKMPETLRFATEYHAIASTSMTLSWILSGMSVPCEEIAEMITKMRGIGMEELFKDGEFQGNPYHIN